MTVPINESISDDAARSAAVSRRKDMAQFVEFEINEQNYAFPIGEIREIVILKSITPTPQVPAFVDGVANLRGSIIPIINLRALFGMPVRPIDDETRTIVVNVGQKIMGCTVDRVSRVLRVEKESIARAPETIVADGRTYIRGFATVNDRLVIILDVAELLSPERTRTLQQATESHIKSE
jgi:purine-binding chemotaxis protein CheW